MCREAILNVIQQMLMTLCAAVFTWPATRTRAPATVTIDWMSDGPRAHIRAKKFR